ncbi:DUF4214 domain-containing protein [Pseudomonas putida]|uniref:DUF4214 domain-containing protein n=1 Tax=Pseudomonas putida TaxID=303 RepID=UPI0018AB8AAE|nr:DUF4214 domain-containing protein [Pseudomonas putida]MBF8765978.1 DUF4214 domain-containing protein [Pseudomonas putida]
MQYDSPQSSSALQDTLNADSANLSENTIAAISSLLNLDKVENVNIAGIEGNAVALPTSGQADIVVGEVEGAKGDQVVVDLAAAEAAGVNAYVLQSDANLVVDLQGQAAPAADVQLLAAAVAPAAVDTSGIEMVVATGNGNDVITVNGDQNTLIDAGDGDDTIVTGNGNNTVIAGNGNNNITTGSGDDTIILSGTNDVVNAGAGFDVVQLDGSRDDYELTVGNSFNVSLTGNQTAAIKDAEFLSFVGEDGETESVALAHNDAEAAALRLYQGILDRDADVSGAKFFTGFVNNGGSLTDVANAFLNSSEFAGANNAADVNDLYQALLGRGTDGDAGASAWTSLLANGGTLADVAAAISVSAEAQAVDASNGTFVESLYEAALGREADEAGLQNWVSQLFNGASRAEIAQSIVGSAEAGAKANADFIDSLYQSALDRTADDAGKAHWAAQLEAGASQADVALGIVGSPEAAAHIDNVVVLHGQV